MSDPKAPDGTHYDGEDSADDNLAGRLSTAAHITAIENNTITYAEAADIASENIAWVGMRVKRKDVSGDALKKTVRRSSLMAYLETRNKK